MQEESKREEQQKLNLEMNKLIFRELNKMDLYNEIEYVKI